LITRIGIDARKADDYGIGTYTRGLLKGLAELTAGASAREAEKFIVFQREGTDLGPLGDRFETRIENAAGYSARELTALSRHAARERLDLFHATHYVLPIALRCPAVVTIHDVLHLRFPDNLRHPAAIVYADRMLRRALDAEGVIAVSQTTRDDLTSAYQVAPSRIDVIPNGVDARFSQNLSGERITALLASLGVGRPYVLFVGNPKPHKNLDVLLAGFRIWQRGRAPRPTGRGTGTPRLVLVGGHQGLEALREKVRELAIEADVDILGHVADEALPGLYQGADLLAFPSLYEGFGLPVLEAMASGTPVLAADTPAVREVAAGAARYAPAGDPIAWSNQLQELLSDPRLREGLSGAGRLRAREFPWSACAKKTLAVYRRVLRDPAGGSGPAADSADATPSGAARPRRENDGGGFAWGGQLSRRRPH
jgi:alpha-1,3-rhamnosyl/mannosyltransferase